MPQQAAPREPSAWQIEKSLAAWQAVREALSADPDLLEDEAVIFEQMAPETAHPDELLMRLIDACAWTERRAVEADELRSEMMQRRDRFLHRCAQMRSAIEDLMGILGHRSIAARLKRASLQRGPVGVRITDADKVPDHLCRVERTPMKSLIHAAIDAGETVAGAELSNPTDILVLRSI
jgi:hypothetical protein